jgi:hypothetical protein
MAAEPIVVARKDTASTMVLKKAVRRGLTWLKLHAWLGDVVGF